MKDMLKIIVRLIQMNANSVWTRSENGLHIGEICVGKGSDIFAVFDTLWELGYLRSTCLFRVHWEAVIIPRTRDLPMILKYLPKE